MHVYLPLHVSAAPALAHSVRMSPVQYECDIAVLCRPPAGHFHAPPHEVHSPVLLLTSVSHSGKYHYDYQNQSHNIFLVTRQK